MKTMNRFFSYLFCLGAFLLSSFSAFAVTNSLPQLQALYGGQIRGLNIIQPEGTTNQIRMFLGTDFSANSIFYADLNYSLTDPFNTNNYSWRVVPDFNAQAGFGTVSQIAVHQASGRLFVADDDGVFSCTTTAGSLVTNIASSGGAMFDTVNIHDSVLLAIASQFGSNVLYFGTISPSGSFTSGAGSPINIPFLHAFSSTAIQLEVNPSNHYVYIIDSYGTNGILKSSATYDALSGATTFSTIPISAVVSNWSLGRQIGFGPEGRMFIGSTVNSTNTIAYSDDDGTNWTVVATGVTGKGNNFDTTGSTSQYKVAFGRAVSTNKGEASSWFTLGAGGPDVQIHANDSSTKFDLINPQLIYFASDQGVGCTTNGGPNLSEIDFGLEAVAIQDLDMNDAKTLGWTASASGLRRGVGAAGALQWAANGTFPWNDGAPYYSIAIDKTDSSGNTIYAGNSVIYKSTDGGTNYLNWLKVYDPAISGELFISSIKAQGSTVFAGIYVWSAPYNGGLVYSANGGTNWTNIALEGTNGVNVNKILITQESGVPTAYVAAEFNTNSNLGGHIYRVTQSGVSHMLLSSSNVSIRDLAMDSAGGIYASGWNQNYQPLVFYKLVDSSEWTQLTTNGLSYARRMASARGPVITIGSDASGNEVPVVGAGVDLYYLSSGASAWTTSSELHYPNGTQLNVLYWDDLLVGTTIGLYGQDLSFQPGSEALVALAGDFDADAKADPAVYNTNGTWKIKLSSGGYTLLTLAGFLGGSGYSAAAGDFDGDGKADPAVYQAATGTWKIKLSSAGYAIVPLDNFLGSSGYTALTGDFDGDRLADPAVYEASTGTWKIMLSSANYSIIPLIGFLGSSGAIALAGDFDGDRLADPAVYEASTGTWQIKLSSTGYITIPLTGFLGSAGYIGMAADFDGDLYADPAVAETSTGNWEIKLSSGNYSKITLAGFLGE